MCYDEKIMNKIIATFFIATIVCAPSVAFAKTKAKVKRSVRVCAECKSLAEGTDRSKAARAASWTGLVIGINEGEHSVILTDAPRINHIKGYAQRSVLFSDATELTQSGSTITFANINIGDRLRAYGSYNANTRRVSATRVEVTVSGAVAPPPQTTPPPAASTAETVVASVQPDTGGAGADFSHSLSRGAQGDDVMRLQKFLERRGFLHMPTSVAYGYFGSMTEHAVTNYQKSKKISAIGIFGPQTRQAVLSDGG